MADIRTGQILSRRRCELGIKGKPSRSMAEG